MPGDRSVSPRRIWLPAAAFALVFAVIAYQLVDVQVLRSSEYRANAADELIETDEIYAQRGAILDRNGEPLALSVSTWDFYVNSRVWADPPVAESAAAELGPFLGIEPADLIATVTESESIDVRIAVDVDYELGASIIDAGIDGVIALQNTNRIYPEGDLAANIIGFTGTDNEGLVGIEAYYNDLLQGRPGRVLFERDSAGDPIPFGMRLREAPEPGSDIVLTIDRYLQRMAEEALAAAIVDHRAAGGAIIMMDPNTGDILALASSPTFDYSTLDLSDPEQTELFRNRTISDLYEPGSVMKVVTAAAAIDAGVVNENTYYVDYGVVDVAGIPLYNWDFNVYGEQSMTGVLEHSINTGAVFMAQLLGAERFQEYLGAFGFGAPSGVDFPGEAEGLYRHPTDDGWSPVDLATQSFGQSIAVTPIQMVGAIAATINGGNLMQPHFLHAVVREDGTRDVRTPVVQGHPISPGTSETIRRMMHSVIDTSEWGHPADVRDYTAGGKSGTANVPVPNGYDDTVTASFVGFAPADNPQLLILVKLDRNADLQTGTQAAGPVFAQVANDALHYLGVPPDKDDYASQAVEPDGEEVPEDVTEEIIE